MTPVEHNPNCAIVRSGDIRAWCDCGAEIPVMNEIRANVSETIGAGKERAAIVRWLRKQAALALCHDMELFEGVDQAKLEFSVVVTEDYADAIEKGAHNETDD